MSKVPFQDCAYQNRNTALKALVTIQSPCMSRQIIVLQSSGVSAALKPHHRCSCSNANCPSPGQFVFRAIPSHALCTALLGAASYRLTGGRVEVGRKEKLKKSSLSLLPLTASPVVAASA